MFKPPLGDVCCAVCTLIWWWSHDSKVCEWYDQYIQFRRISVGFLPCILHCIQFTCSSCPLSGRAVQPYLVHAARPWPHGWPASAAENVDAGGSGLESWLETFGIENRTWQDWTAKGWKQHETIQVNTTGCQHDLLPLPGFLTSGRSGVSRMRRRATPAVQKCNRVRGEPCNGRHDATWCDMMRPNVTDVKTTGLACIMIESYETCETCKVATKSCWYNDMDLSWTAFPECFCTAPFPEFGSRTLMLQVNRITDLSVMHLSSGWAVAISRERLNMLFMLQHIIKIYNDIYMCIYIYIYYISRGSKELSRSYFLNGDLFGWVTWL